MQKQVVISTRMPAEMVDEINITIRGRYLNMADFFRGAIREELFRIKAESIKTELAKDKDSVKAVRKFRRLVSSLFTDEEYAALVKKETKDMP